MNFALNIGARTEAGIQHILFSQLPYRSFIISQVRGLAAHRLVPRQAEPSEVLNDGRVIFRPAAATFRCLCGPGRKQSKRCFWAA